MSGRARVPGSCGRIPGEPGGGGDRIDRHTVAVGIGAPVSNCGFGVAAALPVGVLLDVRCRPRVQVGAVEQVVLRRGYGEERDGGRPVGWRIHGASGLLVGDQGVAPCPAGRAEAFRAPARAGVEGPVPQLCHDCGTGCRPPEAVAAGGSGVAQAPEFGGPPPSGEGGHVRIRCIYDLSTSAACSARVASNGTRPAAVIRIGRSSSPDGVTEIREASREDVGPVPQSRPGLRDRVPPVRRGRSGRRQGIDQVPSGIAIRPTTVGTGTGPGTGTGYSKWRRISCWSATSSSSVTSTDARDRAVSSESGGKGHRTGQRAPRDCCLA
ncbi:hypothetical protein ABIA38_006648 [Embleya sp. AB8]